jgi:hypothetical protein
VREERPLVFSASAELLVEGAHFNQQIHCLPTGNTTLIPKGVYRFTRHQDANRHWLDCVAAGMAKLASGRQ